MNQYLVLMLGQSSIHVFAYDENDIATAVETLGYNRFDIEATQLMYEAGEAGNEAVGETPYATEIADAYDIAA